MLAFKHILSSVTFEAFVDHSALVQIIKSKNEPPTQRLKKIVEKLSAFSFSLGYVKGKSLLVTDYLSRNVPDNDHEDQDRVVLITFSTASSDLLECLENIVGRIVSERAYSVISKPGPVTRSVARKHNISIPSLYPGKPSTMTECTSTGKPTSIVSNNKRKSSPTWKINQNDKLPMATEIVQTPPPLLRGIDSRIKVRESRENGSESRMKVLENAPISTQYDLTNIRSLIPQKINEEVTERFTPPDANLYQEAKPLFINVSKDGIFKHGTSLINNKQDKEIHQLIVNVVKLNNNVNKLISTMKNHFDHIEQIYDTLNRRTWTIRVLSLITS